MRVPVPWVFALVYLLGTCVQTARPLGVGAGTRRAAFAVGVLVFALGAVAAAWAQALFRLAGTTAVPGRISSALVTRGPYRFTRNPMYVGLALAYLGVAAMRAELWPAVLLPLVIVYLERTVIPVEEMRLQATFGVAYDAYRHSVRRWV